MNGLLLVLLAFFVQLQGQNIPTIDGIEYFVVGECMDLGVGEGSRICYCVGPTTEHGGAIHCNDYDTKDCSGDLDDEDIYGGCYTSNEYHVIGNCEIATQQAAATTSTCAYWVEDSNKDALPLDHCRNWDCDAYESPGDSLSCWFECDGYGGIIEKYWNDTYDCTGTETGYTNVTSGDIHNSTCTDNTATASCGVSVTTYDSSGTYCQSSKSPFGVKDGDTDCNYLKEGFYLYAIDECVKDRTGFYTYSRMFQCNSAGDVELYHYMGNGDCKDDDYTYLVKTYSSENYTLKCDGSNCGGLYGGYDDCEDFNFKSQYDENPAAFGACVKAYHDPDTTEYDEPWYADLYMQYRGQFKDRLLGIYYYHDAECKDYQWNYEFDVTGIYSDWEYNRWYDYKDSYSCYPKITGHSNGKDSVTNEFLDPC